MGRRCPVEISVDILRSTLDPVKITRILGLANTDWKTLNKHLDHLVQKGLVEQKIIKFPNSTKDWRVYEITNLGEQFLVEWTYLMEKVKMAREDVELLTHRKVRVQELLRR